MSVAGLQSPLPKPLSTGSRAPGRQTVAKPRPHLVLPVTVGVLAILFTIGILVGWNIIFTRFYFVATASRLASPGIGYWLLLSIGCVFLTAVVATLVMFLVSHVRKTLHMSQQDAFIDRVTHELRSPLASLMLGLETIDRRTMTPDMLNRFIGSMREDVERLRTFIEQILEARRLERGRHDFEPETVSLRSLVDDVVRDVIRRHQLPHSPISIHYGEQLSTTAEVITDSAALRTILVNLLDNAVKYSREPIEVQLTLRRNRNALQIEVADKGIGIDAKRLHKVFRRFYRIPRSTNMPIRGTGLGLYLVATLTRRLGGKVQAHSHGEERGATFRVELPMATSK